MANSDTSRIYDRDALIEAIASGWQPKYVFFWGHTPNGSGVGKHVLSQWWPARFTVDGDTYISAEHYMMAEKARLFGDEETRSSILATSKPGAARRWAAPCAASTRNVGSGIASTSSSEPAVRSSGRTPMLAAYLAETGDKVLVEASPVDRVWGIGLAADDPRAERPAEWQGLNLLGFALMRARTMLAERER